MPLPPLNGSVYWIEADEEVRLYAPDDHNRIGRRAFLAYVLLRHKIIGHPADFWQSHLSHSLIFNSEAQPLLRSVLELHLGDSPTVKDHITDRRDKLRKDQKSSKDGARELQQYESHGAALASQGVELHGIFTEDGLVRKTSGSKDGRFRKLVIADL